MNNCAFCKQPFEPKDKQQRYCSPKCAYACPVRNQHVARGRAKAARTTIARKYAADIQEAGFWMTPELIALLQKVDKRARERGNHARLRGLEHQKVLTIVKAS